MKKQQKQTILVAVCFFVFAVWNFWHTRKDIEVRTRMAGTSIQFVSNTNRVLSVGVMAYNMADDNDGRIYLDCPCLVNTDVVPITSTTGSLMMDLPLGTILRITTQDGKVVTRKISR